MGVYISKKISITGEICKRYGSESCKNGEVKSEVKSCKNRRRIIDRLFFLWYN